MNGPDPRLLRALEDHQEGRLAQAETVYTALLEENPSDPNALHFLGMARFQQRRLEEAIALIRRSLEILPANAHAWNNLGNVLATDEQEEEAAGAYLRAINIDFEIGQAWQNLGRLIGRSASPGKAIALFARIIETTPGLVPAYEALGRVLRALGMKEQAIAVYRRWVELEPNRPTALHLLAANTGEDVPRRAGDSYMVELFDGFARDFDVKLARLEYRAPEILVGKLRRDVGGSNTLADVLDAGCGTGLCGPLLEPFCGRIVGVDLSPGMLEKARARELYEELVCGELSAFMRSRPSAFDAVISADTLVYFGPLEEALSAAAHCLAARGRLAFTVEAWPTEDPAADFRIQEHGRYAHAEGYLRRCLQAAGFGDPSIDRVILRKELGNDVHGFAVLARLGVA
jgi:predicted TPR repeat methyltransferase